MQQLVNAQLANDKTDTIDPWGGPIHIAPGSNTSYVKITLTSIPRKACRNLNQQLKFINRAAPSVCGGSTSEFQGEF